MKIRIDRESCHGHGRCVMTCPELFYFDDDGFGFVKQEDVPPEFEKHAERAKKSCPERAIQIES